MLQGLHPSSFLCLTPSGRQVEHVTGTGPGLSGCSAQQQECRHRCRNCHSWYGPSVQSKLSHIQHEAHSAHAHARTHAHKLRHTCTQTHKHTHTQRQPAACLVQLALCLLYGTMGFPLYASGTMSFFPIRFTGLLVARRVSSFKLRLCQFGVQRLCSDIAPQFWGSIGKLQFCKRVQRHSLESHLTKMNN